ncbi:MAG: DNA repair protein RadC [Eubacteriales bacterium]|nr:DNA repair protein RadC [Eubacteriales bacterium]
MEQQFLRIKDRPVKERPYEKCLEFGVEALSDGELLAVLLRTGTRNHSSLELAWQLLDMHPSYKGLEGLFHLSLEEFQKIPGIGTVKGIQLLCILELSRRLSRSGFDEAYEFQSPDEIAAFYMEDMRHLDYEKVQLLLLNGKHRLLKTMTLSTGDSNSAFVPVKNLFSEALRSEAVYMILLHNHPSGCPEPSKEDLVITKRIKEAGDLLGISLSDHIIIGDRCYFSMREEQLL